MALSEETKAILDFLASVFKPGVAADFERQQDAMRSVYNPEAPPEKVPVRIKCQHPNGYKFTALVVPSKEFDGGRWVQIEDEQWPTDDELCATIDWWHKRKRWVDASRPDLGYDPDTKLWLYDNIRLPILRYVGQELPIDWREDMKEAVKKLRDAAAVETAKLTEALRKVQLQPSEPSDAKPDPKARTPRAAAAPAIDSAK